MKSLRLMLCAMPLMLTGCSTMSSVNWSAANPWNWFGSSTKVSEQGVGELTASTPLQEQAIADALDGDYRLRSGMKTANDNVVRFFEVMKGDNVAMVINGDQGTISRHAVGILASGAIRHGLSATVCREAVTDAASADAGMGVRELHPIPDLNKPT
jgi:hypothetical protein